MVAPSNEPVPEAEPAPAAVTTAPTRVALPIGRLWKQIGLIYAGFIALGFLSSVSEESSVLLFGGLVVLALFALAALRTLWLLGRAVLHARQVPVGSWIRLLGAGLMSALGTLLALTALGGFARGRQLRRRGKLMLPKVGPGASWTTLTPEAIASPALRATLAAQWRENGRTEHASVAAFAQLSLELMGLGAPPELLAAASADALDEIRHAELCFSLARALDGASMGPQGFPEAQRASRLSKNRGRALVELAVESLIDGALLEGFSARLIAQLVGRCEDPATREVLRALAADEGRHAKHGWDVVAWCLDQGSAKVASALLGAARGLPAEVSSTLPEAARGGAWEHLGIAGLAREADAYARTREHVVRRVEAMLRDERRAA